LNYYRASNLRSPTGAPPGETAQKPALQPLPPIATPTLVIWGEKDTALLTGNLEGLDEHVTTLTIKRVPDATHWVVHEKPAVVIQEIREFLKPS